MKTRKQGYFVPTNFAPKRCNRSITPLCVEDDALEKLSQEPAVPAVPSDDEEEARVANS